MISRELEVADVAAATEREHPDLAFVGLGISGEHALDMISEIVREASCPVIALLESDDPVWVTRPRSAASSRTSSTARPQMQSTIDITLRRYAEYANLEGAFARRAVIEGAKGIMMARQSIDEPRAFELMRSQSQRSGQKLFDIAKAVVDSHLLLVPPSELRPRALLAREGLCDVPPFRRDDLQLLRRLDERDVDDRVAVERGHAAEPARVDEVRGLEAEPGRQHAVARGRRAAALDVAEHRHARLEAGALLDLAGELAADAAEDDVAELVGWARLAGDDFFSPEA